MTVLPSPIPHPLDLLWLDAPGWIREGLEWVVGVEWPEGDEKAVWDLAEEWYGVAALLAAPADDAAVAATAFQNSYAGPASEAFRAAWAAIAAGDQAALGELLTATDEVGRMVEECGCDIEAAKLEVWIEVTLLVIELISLTVAVALTLGAATPAAAAALTVSRLAVQRIFQRLVAAMASKGARSAPSLARRSLRDGVSEAAREVALDGGIQAHQVSAGHRDGVDVDSLRRSATAGFAGGAAASTAGFRATGGFADGLARSAAGEVLGEAAAAVSTGGDLTFTDLAMAVTSGARDAALNPDLATRLDGLTAAAGPSDPSDDGGPVAATIEAALSPDSAAAAAQPAEGTPDPVVSGAIQDALHPEAAAAVFGAGSHDVRSVDSGDAVPAADVSGDSAVGVSSVPERGGASGGVADSMPQTAGAPVRSDSAPSVGSDPVPSVGSDPVPSVGSDPVPSVGSDPVPSVAGPATEWSGSEVAASSGTGLASVADDAPGEPAPAHPDRSGEVASSDPGGATPVSAEASAGADSTAGTPLGGPVAQPPAGTGATVGRAGGLPGALAADPPAAGPLAGGSGVGPAPTGEIAAAGAGDSRIAGPVAGGSGVGPAPADEVAAAGAADPPAAGSPAAGSPAAGSPAAGSPAAGPVAGGSGVGPALAGEVAAAGRAVDGWTDGLGRPADQGAAGPLTAGLGTGVPPAGQAAAASRIADDWANGPDRPPTTATTPGPLTGGVTPGPAGDAPASRGTVDRPASADRSPVAGGLARAVTSAEEALNSSRSQGSDPKAGPVAGGAGFDPGDAVENWSADHGGTDDERPTPGPGPLAGGLGDVATTGGAPSGLSADTAPAGQEGPELAASSGPAQATSGAAPGSEGAAAGPGIVVAPPIVGAGPRGGSPGGAKRGGKPAFRPAKDPVGQPGVPSPGVLASESFGIDESVVLPPSVERPKETGVAPRPNSAAGASPDKTDRAGTATAQPSPPGLLGPGEFGMPTSDIPVIRATPEPEESVRERHLAAQRSFSGTPRAVIDAAPDLESVLAAGVTPAQLAAHLDPAALTRLAPQLSPAEVRDVSALLAGADVRAALEKAWNAPEPGRPLLAEHLVGQLIAHPDLVRIMQSSPELRHSLLSRPLTLHNLATHQQAITVLGEVVAETEAQASSGLSPQRPGGPPQFELTGEHAEISSSLAARSAQARQPDFDIGRSRDEAYLTAYVDLLYARSAEAQPELNRISGEIAERCGGELHARSKPKSRQRAMDKVAGYLNDASLLTDLTGAYIQFNAIDDAYRALRMIDSEDSLDIVEFDDRIKNPARSGYRDLRVNVRLSGGHIAELRLHLKAVDDVAIWEHSLFEVRRDLQSVANEAGRRMTPGEQAIHDGLIRAQQRYFWDALQSTRGAHD